MEVNLGNYPSQLADKYMLRLPDGWRDAIKARAATNRRSMNQEILTALEGLVGSAAGEALGGNAPAAGINGTGLAPGSSINRGNGDAPNECANR